MANVAIVQAKPSKMSINKYFPEIVSNHTVTNFSLTDNPDLKKVLVRDTNIKINVEEFDFIILIGTEPLKYFSSKTSITECSGSLVPSNVKRFGEHKGMLAITNPFAMIFRPEAKEPFDLALSRITDIVNGVSRGKAECFYSSSAVSDALIYDTCDKAEQSGVLAMDSETTSFHIHKGHIIGLCLSAEPFTGTYTHADVISEAGLQRIQQVLDNPKVDVVGHNMKFDLKFFKHHFGLNFDKAFGENRVSDTMLMHSLLDERKGHGLKQLANKFTDMGNYDAELDEWKKNYCKENSISSDDFTYDLIPWDIIQEYGCLTKESKVLLEDGSWEEIGNLVASKYSGGVMSLNETTNTFEPKKVTGWYKNKHSSKQWYKVEFNCGVDPAQAKTNSRWGTLNGPVFTPDHRMLTDHGYVEIALLDPSVHKMVSNELTLSDDGMQVVLASLLADGTLQSKHGVGAGIFLSQSKNHRSNLDFKVASLGGCSGYYKELAPRNSNQNGQLHFYSDYTKQFSDMYHELDTRENSNSYKLLFTKELASRLDVRALACWYMDDGNLPSEGSCPRIWSTTSSEEERECMLDWLADLGVEAEFYATGDNAFIQIMNYHYFFKLIAPYMNKDMLYKIKGYDGDDACSYVWNFERKHPYHQTIVSVQKWDPPASRRGYQTSWCIDVEDNHNFVTQTGVVHNCMDADATIRLYHKFLPALRKNAKINWVYNNIMMPGLELLAEMEMTGIPIDIDRAQKVKDYLTKRMHEALSKIYEFDSVKRYEADVGAPFNPGSPVQLRQVLFDYEGLTPTGILTDTGMISTNAEALEKLKDKSPLVGQIAEYRRISKLVGTYLTNMIENVDSDGFLRCGFNQHVTTSGRLSSSGFINLQNLPARGVYGSAVKGSIVAPKGWKILAADLSSAEVYYAGLVSGDEGLCDVFRKIHEDPIVNSDPHSLIAFETFPVKATAPNQVKKLDPIWRQASKAIQFSALYGSGPDALADAINKELRAEWNKNPEAEEPHWYTKDMAIALLDKYFRKYPDLKKWIEFTHSEIVNKGFLYSMVGRKRRAFNHKSPDRSVVAEEQRSCLNAIIQGLSSDCLILGMVAARKEIRERNLQDHIKFIMTVHDSVVMLVRNDSYDIAKELLVRNCQQAPMEIGCSIPEAPIGMEVESGELGSPDYSLGKFEKEFGFLFEEEV